MILLLLIHRCHYSAEGGRWAGGLYRSRSLRRGQPPAPRRPPRRLLREGRQGRRPRRSTRGDRYPSPGAAARERIPHSDFKAKRQVSVALDVWPEAINIL